MPSTRETRAEQRRLKYCRYRDLCAELGVSRQSKRWDSHYAQLRRDHGERVRRSPDERWVPLTKQEIVAWWRGQFTDTEIFQMGSALDFLLIEEGGAR